MSGGTFWALVLLMCTTHAITYVIGVKDGINEMRAKFDLSRRYQ